MNRYAKGRRFEYRVKEWLEERGFYVVRSAGSKGIADLVALKDNQTFLVQCKAYKPSVREINEYKMKRIRKKIRFPFFIFYKEKGRIKVLLV